MSVSATYCVMRYPCSLRSESITASEAGKLRGESDGDQELRREREVSVGGDDGREHLRLKAEQHAQDVRQQPFKGDAGPAQEQHHAHGERGHDQSLLARVERWREERPQL